MLCDVLKLARRRPVCPAVSAARVRPLALLRAREWVRLGARLVRSIAMRALVVPGEIAPRVAGWMQLRSTERGYDTSSTPASNNTTGMTGTRNSSRPRRWPCKSCCCTRYAHRTPLAATAISLDIRLSSRWTLPARARSPCTSPRPACRPRPSLDSLARPAHASPHIPTFQAFFTLPLAFVWLPTLSPTLPRSVSSLGCTRSTRPITRPPLGRFICRSPLGWIFLPLHQAPNSASPSSTIPLRQLTTLVAAHSTCSPAAPLRSFEDCVAPSAARHPAPPDGQEVDQSPSPSCSSLVAHCCDLYRCRRIANQHDPKSLSLHHFQDAGPVSFLGRQPQHLVESSAARPTTLAPSSNRHGRLCRGRHRGFHPRLRFDHCCHLAGLQMAHTAGAVKQPRPGVGSTTDATPSHRQRTSRTCGSKTANEHLLHHFLGANVHVQQEVRQCFNPLQEGDSIGLHFRQPGH